MLPHATASVLRFGAARATSARALVAPRCASSRLQFHHVAPLSLAFDADSSLTKTTPSPAEVRASLTSFTATIKEQKNLNGVFWGNVASTLAKCRTPELVAATSPLMALPMAWHSSTPAVQNEMVRILLATSQLETALSLVEAAPEFPLHSRNLGRLLGACVRHHSKGVVPAAFALFDRALGQGTAPTMSMYHALMLLSLKVNDAKLLDGIIVRMDTAGVPLDAMCHGLCVRMDCRHKQWHSALARYEQMLADGMHLNVVVFNELLEGLCDTNQYADAMRIFEGAVATVATRGWNQKPTAKPTSHAEAKAAQEAENKRAVNEVSYNIIMKLCGRQQRLDEVFKWYEDMKSKGIPPSTATINTAMHGVFHGKYRSIDSQKVYASLATVAAVGAGTLFVSDLSEATASAAITASVLASLGLGVYLNPFGVQKSIYPNDTTAKEPVPAAILRRLDEEEHIGRAMYLWNELLGYGLAPDEATYDIFVRTCVRKRHPEIAVQTLLDTKNPNSFAARAAQHKETFRFELPLPTTVRLLQSLTSQNLIPLVDDLVNLAYATGGLEAIASTTPQRLTRFNLIPVGAPKVTALVLSRVLRLWLAEHYPKDKLHAQIHDTLAFDVIQCHTVLDYLDTIDPEIRASFAFEEVQVAGNGNGVLHFNRERLHKYIFNLELSFATKLEDLLCITGAHKCQDDIHVSNPLTPQPRPPLRKVGDRIALARAEAVVNVSLCNDELHTMPGHQAVQVSCRFRGGIDDGGLLGLEFPSPDTVVLPSLKGAGFTFDHVFSPDATQETIFEHIGAPVIDELLNGYNCTILAYGQTGSGKTHTILGSRTDKGILPRLVQRTFDAIKAVGSDADTEVTTGLFEVYQEKIQDLLNPSNTNLRIREDKERGIWVEGAADVVVADTAATMRLVQKGLSGRSMGSHLMNAESSRSHCIFLMTITQRFPSGVKQTGKLYLVDLAGSEMVRKTAASGKRLDEAKHINKSLTALGLVINALTDGKSKHVPYRDSKLTRLLQNSLGGNAKTRLILTCSSSAEETLSTIRFGARAQHVTNTPQVNTEKTISEYKQLLQVLELRVESLSSYVAALESRSTVCSLCGVKPSALPVTSPPPLERAASDRDFRQACHLCHGLDAPLVLCDGNCGLYWHPQCLPPSDGTNPLEFYCTQCQPRPASVNDAAFNVQDELSALRRALQTIKADRDQLEHRVTVEKQVFDVAGQRHSDIHRLLEERIAEQEHTIQSLSNQLEASTQQWEQAQRDNAQLQHERLQALASNQRNVDANQAEIEIVRRSFESLEKENSVLKAQALELTKRATHHEKRSRELQDQLEACRILVAQRDEDAARLRMHSASTSPIKSVASPGKVRPATALDILNDARMSLQSRGNIQQWWSGSEVEKTRDLPRTNNTFDDPPNGDGPARPFKARLVGLLTSLQEETDAFKDLEDKMAEHIKPKARKVRRNRLPAMDDGDTMLPEAPTL
ncbi:Nkin protein [Achlya hypogyna]|uniref:Nkin protein n=1 Tax=Achlya hypogyna TaxID=1202772 RepID=A0A1V9Z9B6_ACHHY|nr:Nkin protein [Achlya hypogyna]